MKEYSGVLDWFFETGTEGLCWVLRQDNKRGIKALVFIRKGDQLTVYGEDNSVVFEGEIVPDLKAGWTPYPDNSQYGQPSALGFRIHWTQAGWQPDNWARLFVRNKKPLLRAKLVRNE